MPRTTHRFPTRSLAATTLVLIVSASCIVNGALRVDEIERSTPRQIRTPAKAHLVDGTTAVFRNGVTVDEAGLTGRGWRFGLTGRDSVVIDGVPFEDIVAMEAFAETSNIPGTILLTTFGIAAGAAVAAVGLAAAFGSCPTFYSDSAGTSVLEAEGFSYSIAALFEARDVDRLRVVANDAGFVRLEVRNEALETHYINHLELLEAVHAADELVVPTSSGRVVAVRELAPVAARDRSGRRIDDVLAAADGAVFSTAPSTLASRTPDDLRDHIDLMLPDLPAADSIVIAFRMRNSLLPTVLFYDVMLGDQGPGALDWQMDDLQRLSAAVAVGEWGREHLGMRVLIRRDGVYEPVGRVGDPGPIAWKDVAIVVPRPDDGRIRLSFAADAWRIDRLAVSARWRDADTRPIRASGVMSSAGPQTEGATGIASGDDHYLVTSSGQAFTVDFDVGITDQPRTFLLASQGYYTEWVRRDWLLRTGQPAPFRPGPEAIADAMQRWQIVQDSMEQQFFSSRIPVR